MTLAELALGCYIYARLTGDGGYKQFQRKTAPQLDLTQDEHRKGLLKLLNSWGCRQFVVAYHDQAAKQIEEWHHNFGGKLFPVGTGLLSLTDPDLNTVEDAYNDLAKRFAASKTVKGKGQKKGTNREVKVRFGPVGTAKSLFALRPNALMPWDDDIITSLKLDGSSSSYRQYLQQAKEWLNELSKECAKQGFALADLPGMIGRPKSTLPKVIDEYQWVTMTQKWQLKEVVECWTNWS
jgi:hypothetical protein